MKYFVPIFLLIPYLVLLIKFPEFKVSDPYELFSVFKFTFLQAFLSALISTVTGVFVGLSLASTFSSKKYKWWELICYLPCFIPALFIMFSYLNIAQLLQVNISGLFGIVAIHSLINIGLVAALYATVVISKTSLSNKLSLVQGLNKFDYVFKILIQLTIKDIIFIFSTVFIFCFTSFSIPLIIGGVSSTTLELLIYEKLIVQNDVGQAFTLAVTQFLFLVLVMFFANKIQPKEISFEDNKVVFFKTKSFLAIPMLITIFLTLGMFLNFNFSIGNVFSFETLIYSVLFAVICGYSMFCFCQLVFALLPSNKLEKFLALYSSPSTVLVGLAFILLFQNHIVLLQFSVICIFIILFFPYLYKMFVQTFISELLPSLKLARVMGGARFLRFKMISFPLSFHACLFMAFLTSVWVLGDYAVSSLIFEADKTLALKAKNYMRSYRMSEASNVIVLIVICELILFLIYKGILNVSGKKY